MMYSTSILREASAMLQRGVSESVDKHFSGRRERDVLRRRHCNRLRFTAATSAAFSGCDAVSKSAPQRASSSSGIAAPSTETTLFCTESSQEQVFRGKWTAARWPGERSGPKQGQIGPKQHVSARFEARTISTYFSPLQPVSARFGSFRSPTSSRRRPGAS